LSASLPVVQVTVTFLHIVPVHNSCLVNDFIE